MHMIGTNICVWLHVLIQETKHQIMTMVNTNNTDLAIGDMTHAWDHVDDVVEEISEDYFDSVSSHPLPHSNGHGHGGVSGSGGHNQHLVGNNSGQVSIIGSVTDHDNTMINSMMMMATSNISSLSESSVLRSLYVNVTNNITANLGGSFGEDSILGLHRNIRSLNDHYITHSDCRRSNIIGELVTDASQFLFPCTIEYSLICAAILYIMWKNSTEL